MPSASKLTNEELGIVSEELDSSLAIGVGNDSRRVFVGELKEVFGLAICGIGLKLNQYRCLFK